MTHTGTTPGTDDPWQARAAPTQATGDHPPTSSDGLAAFHAWQARCWPRLSRALKALSGARIRRVPFEAAEVVLQWNPARAESTLAAVDAKSIERRPCFLCPQNLPAPERGLFFGPHLVVLANPAPILPHHLVIAHREHRPQALLPILGDALDLALAAPGLTLLYNGPRCGASAPDHLHLQAVATGHLPIECRIREQARRGSDAGLVPLAQCGGARILRVEGHGRAAWLVEGERPGFDRCSRALVSMLEPPASPADDPLPPPGGAPAAGFNWVAWSRRERLFGLVFPRAAHRPVAFDAPEPDRIRVSPGATDLAGWMVTVREEDFTRLDLSGLRRIFGDVSLPRSRQRLLESRLPELLHDR